MNLPQPVTREEIYLAYYIGMRGDFSLPANPATRIETYLAKLCGQSVTLPDEPITNVEMYLAKLCGETVTLPDVPVLRVEMYLAALCGETVNLPEEPYTKTEIYLAYAATSTVYDLDIDGDSATIEDTIEGANLYDPKLAGKTYQDTTTGKNLLNLTVVPDSYAYATASFDSSTQSLSVIANGTNPSDIYYVRYDITGLTIGATYVIKIGNFVNPSQSAFRYVAVNSYNGASTSQLLTLQSTQASGSFTIPSDCQALRIYLYTVADSTAVFREVQIESGSTPTDYEPYTGGLPAPNPDFPMPIKVVTGEQTVKVVGKNIWDPTPYQTNHFIAANGTESTNTSVDTWGNIYIPASSTLSFRATFRQSGNCRVHAFALDGTWIEQIAAIAVTANTEKTATFTTPNQPCLLRWCCFKDPTNAQIEYSEEPTDYEEYKYQSYPINLGKNLFDPSLSVTSYSNASKTDIHNGLRAVASLDGAYTWIAIRVGKRSQFAGHSLTLSGNFTPSANNRGTFGLGYSNYDLSSRESIGNINVSGDSKTYEITDNDSTKPYIYAIFYANAGGTATQGDYVDYTNIQIELGSSASSYSPYKTPIELCNIGNYQDNISRQGDDWKIHREINKIIYDGSLDESWNKLNNCFQTAAPSDKGPASACLSNNFTYNSMQQSITSNLPNGQFGFNTIKVPTFRNDSQSTAQNFRDWLAENNTSIYYPVQTATDTTITDTELISQLNALEQAYAYAGTTNIFITAEDGNLTVEYKAKIRKASE